MRTVNDDRPFNIAIVMHEPNTIATGSIILTKLSEFSCYLGFECNPKTIGH